MRGGVTQRGKTDALVIPSIELRDVWLSFERPVLRGVDLRVMPGETIVVFGESGVGKSTILKLILRLLIPDRGKVLIYGEEIEDLSFERANEIRRRFGMVFQSAALFDSRSEERRVGNGCRYGRV